MNNKDFLLKEQGIELNELYKDNYHLHSIIKDVRDYVDKWLDGKINDDIIIVMNRIGNILDKENNI